MYWELFYRFVNIFDFVISFFVKCSLGMLKWGGVKWVVLYFYFLVIGFLVFYIGDYEFILRYGYYKFWIVFVMFFFL